MTSGANWQLASAKRLPQGMFVARATFVPAVVAILKCSELEAEQLVDTLESRRLIRYQGDPADAIDKLENLWHLDAG